MDWLLKKVHSDEFHEFLVIRQVEQFLRHLKNQILTKLMVLLAGTMIFELAVKFDTESTYFLLIIENMFFTSKIIKNITQINVLKAGTMIFEIRMKKSSRKMDSILKVMHSGQIRHFRGYMNIKYHRICINWRKNCSTYRIKKSKRPLKREFLIDFLIF